MNYLWGFMILVGVLYGAINGTLPEVTEAHVRQLFLQVSTAGTGYVTSGIFPETDSWQCRRQKAGLPVS